MKQDTIDSYTSGSDQIWWSGLVFSETNTYWVLYED